MIYVTRMGNDKTKFHLNHRLIEKVEDGGKGYSSITLESGKVYLVYETIQEITTKIQQFESEIWKRAWGTLPPKTEVHHGESD